MMAYEGSESARILVNSSTNSNLKPRHLSESLKESLINYTDKMCLYYVMKHAYIYAFTNAGHEEPGFDTTFKRVLIQWEMQTAWSRISTQITEFISYYDIHYTTSTLYIYITILRTQD